MSNNSIEKLIKKIPNKISSDWLKSKIENFCNNSNFSENKLIDNRTVKKFNHNNNFYESMIYNTYDISKFEPELEFCETDKQKEFWMYYRLKISSFKYSSSVGRLILILIRDKQTKRYVGIASLSSDILNRTLINKYINWSDEFKMKRSVNLMNISTCVGIPPFCFNYNGGKLIAMLMFSKEVYDYYYNKYNDYLVCLVTLSLYGKSVQYDRLKELKYLKNTAGYGSSHIPDDLYNVMNKFINDNDLPAKNYKNKLQKITSLCKYLKIKNTITKHGVQRGTYIGFTNNHTIAVNYLKGKTNIYKPKLMYVNEIGKFWKTRWAEQRFIHLIKENRLMLNATFDTNIISDKDYDRIRSKKYRDINVVKKVKTNQLSDSQKIEIIKYWIDSDRKMSYNQMEIFFTNKFGFLVSRKKISLLLNLD